MAVVNTKSTLVTNADAVLSTLSDAHLHGRERTVALVEVAASDDDTSVFRFFRVHSSDRVHQLMLLNDAITGGTSYDFGLYETAKNGGAVVSAGLFATAVDLSTARVAPLDITHEALNIDQAEKPVWQLLGLTVDPGKEYDLCATANTVGTAAGTIVLKGTIAGSRA